MAIGDRGLGIRDWGSQIGHWALGIEHWASENYSTLQVDEVHSPCSVLGSPLHYKDMRCTSLR